MFVFTNSVVSKYLLGDVNEVFCRYLRYYFFQWKLYLNSKIEYRSQKHRIVQFGFVVLLNLGNIERGFYDHGYAFLNKCVAFLNVVCCMHYWA